VRASLKSRAASDPIPYLAPPEKLLRPLLRRTGKWATFEFEERCPVELEPSGSSSRRMFRQLEVTMRLKAAVSLAALGIALGYVPQSIAQTALGTRKYLDAQVERKA
jgi:hypothetical protein